MDKKLWMFNKFFNYDKGTIWVVREDLLQERAIDHDPNSTRDCHPCLSIRQTPLYSYERVPVLRGTKRRRGYSVIAKGIFKNSSKIETHFGGSLVPLKVMDFTDSAPDYESSKPTGRMLDHKRVLVNDHKPHLNSDEMRQLNLWLNRKGLSND